MPLGRYLKTRFPKIATIVSENDKVWAVMHQVIKWQLLMAPSTWKLN